MRESLDRGYIITDNITGRRFYFKDIDIMKQYQKDKEWRNYYYYKGKYERASQNYVIQGEAGSITKYAAILFRKWILNNNLQDSILITNIVHDR